MSRFLLTSALILVATATVSKSAFAQTVDIPFSGNVSGGCTFGTPTAATLGINTLSNPTILSSAYTANGGTAGKISVSCSPSAKLSISIPVKTSGPDFTPSSLIGVASTSSGSTNSSSGAAPISLPAGNSIPITIDMYVTNSAPLQAGTYNYKVTLTAAP